jgi:hypothetical protein
MTADIAYPSASASASDCAWFATDSTGVLAVFITGGEGAIPVALLQSRSFFEQEEAILTLTENSTYTTIRTVPSPDSFNQFAARGLYVFDAALCNDFQTLPTPRSYVLMTKPDQPRQLEALSEPLRSRLELLKMDDYVFATTLKIEIPSHVPCAGD